MRKILISGVVTCFLLAILLVVLNYLIDLVRALFGPLILFLFGKDYLEAPLGLVFGFVIAVIVGVLVSQASRSWPWSPRTLTR